VTEPSSPAEAISWQRLRMARGRVAGRWPSPFRLPLEKRPSDVLYGLLRDGDRLLDVGAGDATRRDRVHARFPAIDYVAVDPDPESGADHARLDGVDGPFDAAALLEVVEHVSPETALALAAGVHARLRDGGVVVVSVPCIHTPGRFLRDCTHVTPWAHDELGGLLELAGFQVRSMIRTYPAPWLHRCLRRGLLGPLGHLFGVDYAYSVVAVGAR
jgi:hypothetical protein